MSKTTYKDIEARTGSFSGIGFFASCALCPENKGNTTMQQRKVYLAAPYTHDDHDVVDSRVQRINMIAGALMKKGHIVFSPISHSHPIAVVSALPTDFKFWQAQNHEFIRWCDTVVVAMMPGWKDSKGILDEIEFAMSINKPVVYMEGNLDTI